MCIRDRPGTVGFTKGPNGAWALAPFKAGALVFVPSVPMSSIARVKIADRAPSGGLDLHITHKGYKFYATKVKQLDSAKPSDWKDNSTMTPWAWVRSTADPDKANMKLAKRQGGPEGLAIPCLVNSKALSKFTELFLLDMDACKPEPGPLRDATPAPVPKSSSSAKTKAKVKGAPAAEPKSEPAAKRPRAG